LVLRPPPSATRFPYTPLVRSLRLVRAPPVITANDSGKEATMNPGWSDRDLEATVLDDISLDEPWALVERFSTLVRLSGSDEEARSEEHTSELQSREKVVCRLL